MTMKLCSVVQFIEEIPAVFVFFSAIDWKGGGGGGKGAVSI